MQIAKRGNIDIVRGFVTGLVGIAVVLIVGFIVVNQISTVETNGSTQSLANSTYYCPSSYWNGTYCSTTGTGGAPVTAVALPSSYQGGVSLGAKMATIPTWIGILVVVVMAAVVMMYFK